MMFKVEHLNSHVIDFFKNLGLSDYLAIDPTGYCMRVSAYNYKVITSLDIIAHPEQKDLASELSKFKNSIIESNDIQNIIKEKDETITKLQNENNRLKEYEIYYKMQLKLNHGGDEK